MTTLAILAIGFGVALITASVVVLRSGPRTIEPTAYPDPPPLPEEGDGDYRTAAPRPPDETAAGARAFEARRAEVLREHYRLDPRVPGGVKLLRYTMTCPFCGSLKIDNTVCGQVYRYPGCKIDGPHVHRRCCASNYVGGECDAEWIADVPREALPVEPPERPVPSSGRHTIG